MFFPLIIFVISCIESLVANYAFNQSLNSQHHDHHLYHCKQSTGVSHQNHARNIFKCITNDTYCGDWKYRTFIPVSKCPYRQFTSEQARKCLRNKTLLFTGDSQIRDLGVAVGLFLQGQGVHDSPDSKFDKKSEFIWNNCTKIPYFHSWGRKNRRGVNDYNGYLFPKYEFAQSHPDWNWQIQVWEIYCNEMIHTGALEDVLHNRMIRENNETMKFRKIDLGFWNHGLHDWGWWDSPPYGKNYYSTMVSQWIAMRNHVPTPVVWVSLNNNCRSLIDNIIVGSQKADTQVKMIEEANWYTHKRLRAEKLPYWDAASVLRSPQRCNVSGDGVHVKMFVDIVRANILFNKLCDENFDWIGGTDAFLQ